MGKSGNGAGCRMPLKGMRLLHMHRLLLLLLLLVHLVLLLRGGGGEGVFAAGGHLATGGRQFVDLMKQI
jgi:hypothetical protein